MATRDSQRERVGRTLSWNVFYIRQGKLPSLSQRQLADQAKVSEETIRKIEQGRDPAKPVYLPANETLVRIADVLEVEVADLFTTRVWSNSLDAIALAV